LAGLQQRHEHRVVGLGAGVGLDVGEGASEQLFRPLLGQPLGLVHVLAAAIVAFAGIALGILVGEHRSLRLQHRLGDNVLRGDQLDLGLLTVQFLGDGVEERGVARRQIGAEEARRRSRCGRGGGRGQRVGHGGDSQRRTARF
jgi:hypothetical protein